MLASKQRILWTIPKDPKFSWILPLDSANRRSWSVMRDHELVKFARKFMEEEGINGRHELEKADKGVYGILWKRKLLGEIGFENNQRDWNSMNDEEIVEYTEEFMREGIREREELRKADEGLYAALFRRKLLDKVGFEEKREERGWTSMSDEEIVGYAKKFMEENGISRRGKLQKADGGLYRILRKRRLLDEIRFEERRRDWKAMSDEKLIGYAKGFIEKEEIGGTRELMNADKGLYSVLRRRKLLDKVGFETKKREMRNWKAMTDDEIIKYARKTMEEEGISGREELRKVDSGLCSVLRRRKLLDRVFSSIDQSRRREAILQVVEAMEEFAC
ncbi:hypothetical protein KKB44_06235 [Candidatus Micrarchaeota archaeon]|nr:hypothetical protein [Candidatus Micrarchaeota archaeon]